jgi:hypothetical protein
MVCWDGSVCFSVLVNGTLSSFFSSFGGLRQSDPLSPFLFLIVMEALSKMISTLVDEGLSSGFLGGQGVVVLSTFLTFCLQMAP